jgi:hypothetical protein
MSSSVNLMQASCSSWPNQRVSTDCGTAAKHQHLWQNEIIAMRGDNVKSGENYVFRLNMEEAFGTRSVASQKKYGKRNFSRKII